MNLFDRQFSDYSLWRKQMSEAFNRYRHWLMKNELMEDGLELLFKNSQQRLHQQKLSVAFVAEFSRGKSELINAIFFATYGQRILPSSAGRTTMCPTELLYDPTEAPCLRLLPIETRAESGSTSDFKHQPRAWLKIELDIDSPEQLSHAISRVAESKQVPIALAEEYGLYNAKDVDQQAQVKNGHIEISAWRHAVINLPHPLLMQGLVVIDTPGLNAIGTEPELTLNLIPNADAVLFILAADTGVTKSDIEVWRQHIGGPAEYGRLVVLNKIDAMWDELKSPEQVQQEIARQIENCAQTLGVSPQQVFAVSAQKALLAKVQQDRHLLERSQVLPLERALAQHLVPQRQRIVAEQLLRDLERIATQSRNLIRSRNRGVVEQLYELNAVRGKNANAVERLLERIEQEKQDFDQTLTKLQATRQVFTRLSNELYKTLGMDSIRGRIAQARERMTRGRVLALGVRGETRNFFQQLHDDMAQAENKMLELRQLVDAMTKRFATEHAMTLPAPMAMTLRRYHEDLEQVEKRFEENSGPLAFLSLEKSILASKFFEAIASRVKDRFTQANQDVEGWLQSLMGPIESQTREHQRQVRRNLESIKRVHQASGELEEKIAELQKNQSEVEAFLAEHDTVANHLRQLITQPAQLSENQLDAVAA